MANLPVTTFLAEDEELARLRLRRAIESRPEFTIAGEAADGETALRAIEALQPRLLLADVQMPGLSGLDLVRALDCRPHVIFCTAFDQYAVQAFDLHSLDYLLKPYSRERLMQALDRVLEREHAHAPSFTEPLQAFLRGLEMPRRLAVRRAGEIFLFPPDEILWFESADTLTFVHTQEGKFTIHRTLDHLEQELAAGGFFRSHRAALVNLRYVRKITPLFQETCELTLQHVPRPIPVSRRRARELRRLFPW